LTYIYLIFRETTIHNLLSAKLICRYQLNYIADIAIFMAQHFYTVVEEAADLANKKNSFCRGKAICLVTQSSKLLRLMSAT